MSRGAHLSSACKKSSTSGRNNLTDSLAWPSGWTPCSEIQASGRGLGLLSSGYKLCAPPSWYPCAWHQRWGLAIAIAVRKHKRISSSHHGNCATSVLGVSLTNLGASLSPRGCARGAVTRNQGLYDRNSVTMGGGRPSRCWVSPWSGCTTSPSLVRPTNRIIVDFSWFFAQAYRG
jgi:hypothetical protein